MFGQLVPCGGGDTIPLLAQKVLVGRKSGCDVRIPAANVSSRHCELELMDGYWFVRDLGSTNGVRVRGEPCDSKWVLPGDELTIARHRYTLNYTPPADVPPPLPDAAYEHLDKRLLDRAGISVSEPDQASSPSTRRPASRERTLGQLVPQGGGATIQLTKPRLTVGRHRGCDLVLRYPTISSRHCELEFIEGYWLVRDLGSRNGIRVNGSRAASKWLKPGNVLTIANLRFTIQYTQLSDAPPPSEETVSFARSLMDRAGLLRRKKGS